MIYFGGQWNSVGQLPIAILAECLFFFGKSVGLALKENGSNLTMQRSIKVEIHIGTG